MSTKTTELKYKMTVDTMVNRKGLDDLQKELKKIQEQYRISLTAAGQGKGSTAQLEKAARAAEKLSKIMTNSWDPKLGQLNLTTFRNDIEHSFKSMEKLKKTLTTSGTSGAIAFNKMASEVLNTNVQLKTSNKLLDDMADTFGKTVKWGISSSIFNSLTGQLSKAYGFIQDLDKSLNNIQIVANKSADQMREFAKQANKAAGELGSTTRDYAEAALIFYQQGLDGELVEKRTETVIKMANVTKDASEEVSSYMTAIWNNFYEEGGKSLEYYADVLAKLGAKTASSTSEIAGGLEKFVSVGRTIGLSYEYATSALATIVATTRQSEDTVGTALKTLFSRIQGLSLGETLDDGTTLTKYSEALHTVGINIKDQYGELKDMDDILDEIGSKWGTLSKDQRVALAQTVAGVRQYNQLVSLMDNWSFMQENLNTARSAEGELNKQNERYLESLEAHLNKVSAASEKLYNSIFDTDSFKDLVDIFAELIDNVASFNEALGGGLNSLVFFGSQLSFLFNKQIARGIENVLANIKLINQNKEDIKTKQMVAGVAEFSKNTKIPTNLSMGLDESDVQLSFSESEKSKERLIASNNRILDLQGYITEEEAKVLITQQKEITELDNMIAKRKLYNQLVTKANLAYDSPNEVTLGNLETELEYRQEILQDSLTAYRSFNQSKEEGSKIDKDSASILLANLDIIKAQGAEEKDLLVIEDVLKNSRMISIMTDKQQQLVLDAQKTTEEQIRNEIEKINAAKKVGVDLDERDEETLIRIRENEEASLKGKLDEKEQEKMISKFVQGFSIVMQILPMVTGGIQALTNENAKGAEKAAGAWNLVGSAAMGVGTLIAGPVGGMIGGGIAEIVKGGMQLFGVWDNFEDLFKSNKERLEEISAELDEINKKEAAALDKYSDNRNAENYFTEIEDKFNHLQKLAEQGLLTDSQRTEYESYLRKIQEYNDDIVISYDTQGNMIATNTKLIEGTIAKLKDSNELLLKQTFNTQNWTEKTGVLQSQYKTTKASYNERKKASENKLKNSTIKGIFQDVVDDWDSDTWTTDFTKVQGDVKGIKGAPVLTDEYFNLVWNLINNQITDEQYEKIKKSPELLKKAFDAANTYMAGSSELWDEFYENVDKTVSTIKKHPEELQNIYNSTLGSITLDKSLILNELKYNTENSGLYEDLTGLGVDNIDNIITAYLEGINLGADEFQTDGIIDYNKIKKKMIDFESGLKTILLNSSSAATFKAIKDINAEGKTSEEYEKLMIAALNDFLKTITDEAQFNKIKDMIPQMFGLDSVDVSFDKSAGHAVLGANGGNLVTQGEKNARFAGRQIAAQYDNEKSKKMGYDQDSFANDIEAYLQKNFDETTLANLDTSKLTESFNKKLINALDPEKGGFKEGLTLDGILQEAIDEQVNSAQLKVSAAITRMGELDDDVKSEALASYAEHLMLVAESSDELADSLKTDAETATAVANSVIRMNTGIDKLADNFKDWNSVIKKSDKISQEYSEAIDGMRDAVSDLLDVDADDISEDFLTDEKTLSLLNEAAKGSAKAIDELRDKLTEDMVLDIAMSNNIDSEAIEGIKSDLEELRNMDDIEIGTKIDLDKMEGSEAEFLKKCQQIVSDAHMTQEQANAFFDKMGFTATYKTETKIVDQKVPRYITTKKITARDPLTGQPTEWSESSYQNGFDTFKGEMEVPAMAVDSDGTETPIIQTLTRTSGSGSMNNYSSKNKGGKSPGKSGGGSKAKENNKSDDQLNRYQEVDEKLKDISTTLSRLEKQEEKVFGKDLIENLNKQYEKLNNQIEITNRKLKIAKDEQSELVSSLSNYGIQFNSDGTINQRSYEEAFKREQARYTSAKTDDEAAKERWETFKEDIKNYESLTLDMIPGLIDAIQDVMNKQIENNITKFNMEIELRLDLSEAEREWNEFNRKVLKGIKDDNIVGNAETRLQDLSSYYKNNGLGSVQRNASQVQRIQKELAIMRNGGTSAVYGDDQKSALEDLEKYNQQLMEDLTQIEEIREEIHEAYLDQMDEIQDKFDEQIESYEYISGLIEHNMDLVKLLKGEEAFGDLQASYDMASANLDEQLKSEMAQLEFWKKERQRAVENGDEEYIKKAEEMIKNSIESVNDTVIEKINNAKDSYINSIHAIFDEMSKQMTNGKGLAYIGQEWELINRNADRYLTNLNAMYGIQQLQDKYLQSIDSSDNVKYQQRLNKLMEDEMKALREKDKISQHDLDRANKRYEIALKQIALEEAQQAKTTMRLRRDSQGNYSYQYVADNDEMEKLKLELSELYNQLYNLDLEKYNEVLNEAYSVWQEYQEKMLEAAQINDPEERANQELLIKEQYGELINNLTAEYANLRLNLEESSMSHLFNLYGRNVENFQLMSETQQQILQKYLDERVNAEAMAYDNLFGYYNQNLEAFETMAATEKQIILDDMVPTWTNGLQEMITTLSQSTDSFIGIHDSLISQIYDKLSAYEQAVYTTTENVTGESGFGSVEEALKRLIEFTEMNISSAQSWKEQDDELIISCTNLMDAVDNVNDALETFNTVMENSEKNAKKAAEEVYNYIKAVKEADALAAKKEAEKPSTPIEPTPAPSQPAIEPEKPAPEPSKPTLTRGSYVNVKTGTKWYENSYGQGKSGVARSGSIKYINTNGTHPYNIDGLGWIKKSNIVGYRTGGYTGDWSGTEGKLAFLHQKELILNANDTENILKTVALLRGVTGQLNGISANFNVQQGSGLQQDVHIEATFPNVTSSNEIENALNNLVNAASQRINRR